jgi:heme ABC exporter ATP-binding subunit CcmA
MASAIRLRGAVCLLARFPALAGVDLDVARGEVVHLWGPNGAGKTTLLRVCAGLVALAEGEAEVLGCDLRRDRRTVRRRVGLLGHAAFLYDDLTVAENVAFLTRARRVSPDRVGPALARFGLDGRLAEVAAGRLSAGQRRRTALAALVAGAPDLWLLDEPHAALDAESRDSVDSAVVEAAAAGAAVLFASHDHDRAAALAHRRIRLSGGVVERQGAGIDVA